MTFDEQKERDQQRGDEWQFGAIQTDLAPVPLTSRTSYLPTGDTQANIYMDTEGCASRAPLNILETKLDYFYENGMHHAIQEWCDKKGYRVNGKFALCDAFIEILSGTTKNGNSLKAPVDTIRTCGVIPKALLPLEPSMIWDEYMNPNRITKAHEDLGKEFLRRITINYEQVPLAQFKEATTTDSLDVALSAYGPAIDGVYQDPKQAFNHAVDRISNEIDIFDSYSPYLKRLVPDYNFFEWGYSLSITNQNPYPDETLALFEVLQKYGLLRFFAEAFNRLVSNTEVAPISPVAEIPAVISTPAVETPVEPPVAPQPLLWDTPQHAFHSTRVLCDSAGLSLKEKDIICAVIMGESGFDNRVINRNKKDGAVTSSDWGIVQCNDYFHIGEGKDFESVEWVLANPEKMVQWMIQMYKAGQLRMWCAYSNKSYLKFLSPKSEMWKLKVV